MPILKKNTQKIPTAIVVHDYIDASPNYPNFEDANFGEDYSQNEQEQLRKYSADSTGINLFLLANHHANEPIPSIINTNKGIINFSDLDSAINKTTIDNSGSVYAGLGFDPRNHSSSDGKIHFPGYTSVTTDPELAQAFTGSVENAAGSYNKHLLHIKLNDQNKVAPLVYENEMVIPRNTTIKLLNSYPDDIEPDMMIHDSVIVPSEINNVDRNEDFIKKLHNNFHDYIVNAPQFSNRVKNLIGGNDG